MVEQDNFISKFLSNREIKLRQRIERNKGGQYLESVLKEFYLEAREQILTEVELSIKNLRRL